MYLKLTITLILVFLAIFIIDSECEMSKDKEAVKFERIIGGEAATNAEAPYHVAIKVAGKYICGGTLITPQHILTAAHCLVDVAEYPFLPLTVVAGTDKRSKGGVEKRASEIFIHPRFGQLGPNNDIGVIKLAEPFVESQSIKTAKLPKEQVEPGDEVTVTGYGRYSPYILSASDQLKKLSSTVLNCDNFIGKYLGLVGDADICVKKPSGEGICNGDSGSPLVNSNGAVVGIASRVFGCAARTPDIYTGVHSYLKFINDAINDKTEERPKSSRWTPPIYDILYLFRFGLPNRYFFFYN